ncbi:MAG: sigma-70 family RNA polymerase sigma factor [Pseudomonadota bacterium]|nr:sigma-70 family RNA polymerase sigma factor [Pseudomonadota bacterium]
MNSHRILFEDLVKSFAAELYSYAFGLCGDRHLAEDLVQETFLRAWNGLAKLRDQRAARGWLYTILRREHARLYQRSRPETLDINDLNPAAVTRYDVSTEAFAVRLAVDRLPPDYREPLLLQVVAGFDSKEIAKILALTPATVMARVSRARRKLREMLAGQESRANPKGLSR